MRLLLLALLLLLGSTAVGHWPDGTLVFSSKKGIVGNVAKRLTGGDQYTHVAIVFDGQIYESDFPRAKRTPVVRWGKRGSTNDFYVPRVPLDEREVAAMKSKATGMLGTPYRLRAYFRPGARSSGTWCSPYVGRVLSAGGRHLTARDYHEPQTLLSRIGHGYQFAGRVRR